MHTGTLMVSEGDGTYSLLSVLESELEAASDPEQYTRQTCQWDLIFSEQAFKLTTY